MEYRAIEIKKPKDCQFRRVCPECRTSLCEITLNECIAIKNGVFDDQCPFYKDGSAVRVFKDKRTCPYLKENSVFGKYCTNHSAKEEAYVIHVPYKFVPCIGNDFPEHCPLMKVKIIPVFEKEPPSGEVSELLWGIE